MPILGDGKSDPNLPIAISQHVGLRVWLCFTDRWDNRLERSYNDMDAQPIAVDRARSLNSEAPHDPT
jgi:hypothetical protein